MTEPNHISRILTENDTLRERVRQLESVLAPRLAPPPEWRLTPAEARLFAALTTRDLLPTDALYQIVRLSDGRDKRSNLVSVRVSHIRMKTKDFGVVIETDHGVGYRLLDRLRWKRLLREVPDGTCVEAA